MTSAPFPEDFWWGSAASSTQTEGAAPRSDWYRWEEEGRAPRSAPGNSFATEYAGDFALLAEHGLTHHRLSLEWARLEPEPGKHDQAAIEHYRMVLTAARDAGVHPWVCLHHFTLPGWFSYDEGGFLDDRARSYHWPRHIDFVGETFGDLVFGWQPINEPVAYAFGGFLMGSMPPGKASVEDFAKALRATHLANHQAWRALRGNGQPVSTIMNLTPLYPAVRSRHPDEAAAAEASTRTVDQVIWTSWIRALRDGVLEIPGLAPEEVPEMAGSFDLIGFSYYSAASVHADLTMGPYPADGVVGPLDYVPWSEGLAIVLRRLADELPHRPLLVCEYGLGTAAGTVGKDDEQRSRYLREGCEIVRQALADGIDVRGLFHWTAVDNYEWLHGHEVEFGLFDRQRDAKASAAVAKQYATMVG